ncbi:hypothetical protein CYMTET_8436 [Cymbomonas tetramitiformis]|uniref:SAP domain-containing protein n=1 Tax=Cymbomonas tetramitiformis TaxID=36881 RepID=A0AAE0GTM0_9CHLO|nr:hypothetical protein CYMTET_8436 [Cymbomonas tetramitiformis]
MQTIDVELLTQGDLEEDSSYIPMGTSFDTTTTHGLSPDDIHETQTTEAASSEPPANPTCDPRTDQPEADTESVDPDARSGGGALLVQRPDSVSPAVTVQAEPTDLATTIGSSSTATLQQTSMQPNIEGDREDTGCVELEGTNVDGSAPTGEEGSSVAAAVVGASESAPLLPTQAVAQPSTTLETAILISDSALIPNLSVKELKAQCKLRRIAQSGNKADLQTKLVAHISAHPSFVVADPSIAFDDLGARVDVATTTRAATRAPVPAWTEISVEHARNLRLRRPEWVGDEEGGPSQVMKHLTPDSHPIEYFDMFISPEFRHGHLRNNTNLNAAAKCAGGDIYPGWKPVKADEIDKYIGILMRNGLSPVPDIRLMWANPSVSFVYGDDRVHGIFPRGVHRYKEIKSFLHVSSPIKEPPQNKPLFKVQDIVDHLISNSKRNWTLGRHLSKDEIDIGFQGRCALKDKIKYKGEGDGFLLDGISERGYLWTCHFRHDPCPTVQKDASPLHNRCLYLAEKLDTEWNSLWFDNLFTSKNFLGWLYDRKKLGAGVCRASGRGLPSCVVQEIATKKADLEAAVGTIKVARSADFKTLAFSIYDAKPVHFMSTHHSCVKEIVKTRKIWDVNESRKVDLEFKRLNAIDDYNHHMNGLDICDQLRNQYRMDGIWQRELKWWHPIFKWAIEVGWGNAYLCYQKVCKRAKMEKPLSHRQFLEAGCRRLCGVDTAVVGRARGGSRRESVSSTSSSRAPRMTPNTVELWVSRFSGKHPMKETELFQHCQWCRYKSKYGKDSEKENNNLTGNKRKGGDPTEEVDSDSESGAPETRKTRMGCAACRVWLCGASCWNEWHGL